MLFIACDEFYSQLQRWAVCAYDISGARGDTTRQFKKSMCVVSKILLRSFDPRSSCIVFHPVPPRPRIFIIAVSCSVHKGGQQSDLFRKLCRAKPSIDVHHGFPAKEWATQSQLGRVRSPMEKSTRLSLGRSVPSILLARICATDRHLLTTPSDDPASRMYPQWPVPLDAGTTKYERHMCLLSVCCAKYFKVTPEWSGWGFGHRGARTARAAVSKFSARLVPGPTMHYGFDCWSSAMETSLRLSSSSPSLVYTRYRFI